MLQGKRINGHSAKPTPSGHSPADAGLDGRSAAKEILEYERDVKKALASLFRRSNFEPAETKTPLMALMETEEEGRLDEWGLRDDAIRRFLIYIAQDGPDPRNVMRAVYAVGAHMGVAPFCELTLRERALMLGDSHGAQHWRTMKLAVNPVRRSGGMAYKAPGQKGSEASAIAAAAQTGNQNRKKKAASAAFDRRSAPKGKRFSKSKV